MRALCVLCCVMACDGVGSGQLQQASGDTGPPPCITLTRMPWPQVENPNGHRVLMPPHLITIAPSNFRGPDEQNAVFQYAGTLVNDNWLIAIAEDYVADPSQLQLGTHHEIVGDPLELPLCGPCLPPPLGCPTCPTQLTHLQVEQYIQQQIDNHPKIPTGPNDIYVVLFPQNINVSSKGGGVATFHSGFSELGGPLLARDSGWAAIQHNEDVFDLDQYTITMSHEIAEAITDTGGAWALRFDSSAPVTTQSPWIAIGNEVGDLCAGARTLIDGPAGTTYVVERPLSNTRAAGQGDPCIPNGPAPYFNTSVLAPPGFPVFEWVQATSKTVTIAIHGWIAATGPSCDFTWSISAKAQKVKEKTNKTFTPKSVTLDKTTLSNGELATITVKIPAGTKAGRFGVVRVTSTPTASPLPRGFDEHNDAYYGIFVPQDL